MSDSVTRDAFLHFVEDVGKFFAKKKDIPTKLSQLENDTNMGGGSSLNVRLADVTLLADAWAGDKSPYSQIVSIPDVTSKSQIDLTPNAEQLAIFHNKDLAFVTENDNGVVTVYAIGQKPENDYIIQATITEVNI